MLLDTFAVSGLTPKKSSVGKVIRRARSDDRVDHPRAGPATRRRRLTRTTPGHPTEGDRVSFTRLGSAALSDPPRSPGCRRSLAPEASRSGARLGPERRLGIERGRRPREGRRRRHLVGRHAGSEAVAARRRRVLGGLGTGLGGLPRASASAFAGSSRMVSAKASSSGIPGSTHSSSPQVGPRRVRARAPRRCRGVRRWSSDGMIHILLESPRAICGRTWRYW